MLSQRIARGALLTTIAVAFGATAIRYRVGSLKEPGPGLFPIIVSGSLLLLALFTFVRAPHSEEQLLRFQLKHIGLITLSLSGFVVISNTISTIAGIAFLTVVSSFAAQKMSWIKVIFTSLGLLITAIVFQIAFGLNLGLP